MRQCQITVWDYYDVQHGGSPYQREVLEPVRYDVEAWCLQGETGFRAFFIINETLYEAHGDDGHWWLVGRMNVHWLKEYKETLDAVKIPTSVYFKMKKKAAKRYETITEEEVEKDIEETLEERAYENTDDKRSE